MCSKSAFFVLFLMFFTNFAFAQDFKSTSKTVPDLTAKGWERVQGGEFQDQIVVKDHKNHWSLVLYVVIVNEDYRNFQTNWVAKVFLHKSPGGLEEFAMIFSDGREARFAIKIDEKWFVASELFDDNNPKFVELTDPVITMNENTLSPFSVKARMETTEGAKERVLKLERAR